MPSTICRRPLYAVGCALAALAAACASSSWADPAPSFEDLVAQAAGTPIAAEAEALVESAQARVDQARVRPNPTLSVEGENIFGSGPFQGFDGAETTVSLSQDLELWGQRTARTSLAQAEAQVVTLRRDATRLDLASRLAITYAEAEAAQRRLTIASEALTLTVADARAAMALVEEGREPLLRGIQGQSDAAAARAAQDAAKAERDAAFAQLSALVNSAAPLTSISSGLLDRTPRAPSTVLMDTPALLALAAERDAAQQRAGAEDLRRRPDISASVGVRRFADEKATALTAGISVRLPFSDQNRGNIDAAQAEVRAADARFRAARLTAEADRRSAQARLASFGSRVSAADAAVEAATEAHRLTRIGFDAGRLSQLELRTARLALLDAQNAALEARLARVRAEADLARLEGRLPFGATQ